MCFKKKCLGLNRAIAINCIIRIFITTPAFLQFLMNVYKCNNFTKGYLSIFFVCMIRFHENRTILFTFKIPIKVTKALKYSFLSTSVLTAAAWQNQQNNLCAQWRLKSAWAFAQSDQNLRCAFIGSQGPNVSSCRRRKVWSDCADTQADLRLRWTHRSFCLFSHAAALNDGTDLTDSNKCKWVVRRKLVFGDGERVWLKPSCSATEASNSPGIWNLTFMGIILSRKRITKALARLRECSGCSPSSLFAYGINRFLVTWLKLNGDEDILKFWNQTSEKGKVSYLFACLRLGLPM